MSKAACKEAEAFSHGDGGGGGGDLNGSATNHQVGVLTTLHHKIYKKPSRKDLEQARPCRLAIVFTFILFLVGFLVASVVLIAITDKCNNREKDGDSVSSRMQYQVRNRLQTNAYFKNV